MSDSVDKADAWDAVVATRKKYAGPCPDPKPNRADSTMELIAEIERLRSALMAIAEEIGYVGVPVDSEACNHYAMMCLELQGVARAALSGDAS